MEIIDVYSEELRDYIYEVDNAKRREVLLLVEKEIKRLNTKGANDFYLLSADDETIDKIEDLVNIRCFILNNMFQATDSEIKRFKTLNNLLYELTLKTYRRTANLYRTLLKSEKCEWFDDDYCIEGTLRFGGYNDETSVLQLEEDDFYGSDFAYMLDVVHVITDKGRHSCEEIIQPFIHYNPEHTPNITDVELDCYDDLDDGVTWAEGWLRHPKLDSICVCYAIHDICTHKPYSIPDLLRMNDFWCEVKLVCQHIVQQDGARWNRDT